MPRGKARLLHFFSPLKTGGAASQFISNLRHIDHDRFDHIVCSSSTPRAYQDELRSMGCKLVSLEHTRDTPTRKTLMRLVKLIRGEEIDLIHVHLMYAELLGTAAGKLCGIPVISTLHGPWLPSWRSVRGLLRKYFVFHAVDHFVAISEKSKGLFVSGSSIPEARIRLIYNGIDAEQFAQPTPSSRLKALRKELNLKPSDPVLLNVGRLDPVKGQRFLVPMMRNLVERWPSLRLLIAGEGGARAALQEQIERANLENHIQLLGLRSDVKQLLEVATLFVFPSLIESFGNAVLEAMATGCPVVASRTGAIPELISDGKGGVLVPTKSPEELTDAVSYLLRNSSEANSLAASAQKRARTTFSIRRAAKQMEALYWQYLP